MRALVVDDARAVRLIIGKILRELGLDVIDAGDGQEALEQLRRHPDVELVLVDWNMPVMNGLDFVKAVRARPELSGVRVVMVTTEVEMSQLSLALSSGADEYVMKPFTADVLRDKLSVLGVCAA